MPPLYRQALCFPRYDFTSILRDLTNCVQSPLHLCLCLRPRLHHCLWLFWWLLLCLRLLHHLCLHLPPCPLCPPCLLLLMSRPSLGSSQILPPAHSSLHLHLLPLPPAPLAGLCRPLAGCEGGNKGSRTRVAQKLLMRWQQTRWLTCEW